MEKGGYVYILASARNGTLYVGVTSDLLRRISEHRQSLMPGFTTRYGVSVLVWYEQSADIVTAISREKAIKRWRRDWKLALIETTNPDWLDLWPSLCGEAPGPKLQRVFPKVELDPGSSPG